MKNGLRMVAVVVMALGAACLMGYLGFSWLQQLRQKLEKNQIASNERSME